ncbi:MAG TPA: SOS response-associated peptidase family protein, partial [Flavobacteriales bacterium]
FLKKYSTYNAKSETAGTSSTFKSAVKEGRRCLIPITAFREFQHRNNGKLKVPFDIKHAGEDVMCLLGLYNDASYTILTTEAPAGSLMAEIHNSKLRQPCIVDRAFERDWLSPNLSEEDVKRFCEASHEVELVATTDYVEHQPTLF